MVHSADLLEQLDKFGVSAFEGEVFRACRKGLDPIASSTRGGRWAARDGSAVLYTSLSEEGALAELSFHWSQLNPMPSKPAVLHRLRVTARRSLRLIMADLNTLGVDENDFTSLSYRRCQEIGEAVNFLECDGLIVPSARWDCENLVLFTEHHSIEEELSIEESKEVDWLSWAKSN